MKNNTIVFLGTGASVGVPVIGCQCRVCTSPLSQNKRLRPSLFFAVQNKRFLIDVGPDFRLQALKYHIDAIDGILLTHPHFDHVAGIPELLPLCFKREKPIPFLLSPETAHEILHKFDYLFLPSKKKTFDLELLPNKRGEAFFQEVPFSYFTYEQQNVLVNGFRLGSFAYVSDIRSFEPSIFNELNGVETLIISALRTHPSLAHFSIEEALYFCHKAGVANAWITHISHDLEHFETNAALSSHIQLAYDGLEIPFSFNY